MFNQTKSWEFFKLKFKKCEIFQMVEFHFKLNSIYLKQIKIKPTCTKFLFVFIPNQCEHLGKSLESWRKELWLKFGAHSVEDSLLFTHPQLKLWWLRSLLSQFEAEFYRKQPRKQKSIILRNDSSFFSLSLFMSCTARVNGKQ